MKCRSVMNSKSMTVIIGADDPSKRKEKEEKKEIEKKRIRGSDNSAKNQNR